VGNIQDNERLEIEKFHLIPSKPSQVKMRLLNGLLFSNFLIVNLQTLPLHFQTAFLNKIIEKNIRKANRNGILAGDNRRQFRQKLASKYRNNKREGTFTLRYLEED
jgi:hypothetical protein